MTEQSNSRLRLLESLLVIIGIGIKSIIDFFCLFVLTDTRSFTYALTTLRELN